LHEYTNVSLRCILTFEWKWEVSNAQRMVRRISTKQGHSNFCRHPENDARPSSSRNSRWYVYIIKEQKTRNLHKLSSPTKISVYIYPCYCTTTFWNLTFASCNNNAGHHQKVKISPRKNIFHCNPFYCILWKSTVYLLCESFKTRNATWVKTWRSQKSNSTFWWSFGDRIRKSHSFANVSRQRHHKYTGSTVFYKIFPCFVENNYSPLFTDLFGAASLLAWLPLFFCHV
jgi:hypothetical protein